MPELDKNQLRRRIVEIVAEVRAMPVDELWREIEANRGQMELDSKEAEVVIGVLEDELGIELAKPEDLRPEQLVELQAFLDLLWKSCRAEAGVSRSSRSR